MACPSGHPTWPYSLLIFVESSLELMENFSRDRAEVSQSLHFALGSQMPPQIAEIEEDTLDGWGGVHLILLPFNTGIFFFQC